MEIIVQFTTPYCMLQKRLAFYEKECASGCLVDNAYWWNLAELCECEGKQKTLITRIHPLG